MGHLTEGVYPGISTPSGVQTHWAIGETGQTGFERALDGERVGLPLPAVVARSTVFETQLNATRG